MHFFTDPPLSCGMGSVLLRAIAFYSGVGSLAKTRLRSRRGLASPDSGRVTAIRVRRVNRHVVGDARALQGRKPSAVMLEFPRVRRGSQGCGVRGSFCECAVVLTLRLPRDLALRNAHLVQNYPDQTTKPMCDRPDG